MNKNIWNAGSKDKPHPVEDFWEERFLIYPNDPRSGPLRKHEGLPLSTEQKPNKCSSTLERSSEEPMFSLKGLKSVYTPFGNGPGMCPGRHFAKQKVVCTLAICILTLRYKRPKGGNQRWTHRSSLQGPCRPRTRFDSGFDDVCSDWKSRTWFIGNNLHGYMLWNTGRTVKGRWIVEIQF